MTLATMENLATSIRTALDKADLVLVDRDQFTQNEMRAKHRAEKLATTLVAMMFEGPRQ